MEIVDKINNELKAEVQDEKKEKNARPIPDKLTPEQEKIILDLWNNADKNSKLLLKDFVEAVFPGCDGRSKEAKLVKAFIASRKIKAESTFGYKAVEIELTDDDKKFITNNIDKMTAMEITRTLFNSDKISALDKRFIVVNQFCNTLDGSIKYKAPNEARTGLYRPPKNLTEAINKVNQYIRNGIDLELAKKDKKLQECLNMMIRFCHSHHFILKIDNYQSDIDKNLFEGRFVSYVWDKPDLTEEEVDAYILLCSNIVNHSQLQRQKDALNTMLDEQMDEKDGKVYMSMIEMINGINKSIDECEKRQDKLRKDLTGLRSSRIEVKTKENQSVLQLVEAWRDEEKRKMLLRLAEKRKAIVRDEISNIESMDQFKAEIYGIDPKDFD